jgi:hypothetical protein
VGTRDGLEPWHLDELSDKNEALQGSFERVCQESRRRAAPMGGGDVVRQDLPTSKHSHQQFRSHARRTSRTTLLILDGACQITSERVLKFT